MAEDLSNLPFVPKPYPGEADTFRANIPLDHVARARRLAAKEARSDAYAQSVQARIDAANKAKGPDKRPSVYAPKSAPIPPTNQPGEAVPEGSPLHPMSDPKALRIEAERAAPTPKQRLTSFENLSALSRSGLTEYSQSDINLQNAKRAYLGQPSSEHLPIETVIKVFDHHATSNPTLHPEDVGKLAMQEISSHYASRIKDVLRSRSGASRSVLNKRVGRLQDALETHKQDIKALVEDLHNTPGTMRASSPMPEPEPEAKTDSTTTTSTTDTPETPEPSKTTKKEITGGLREAAWSNAVGKHLGEEARGTIATPSSREWDNAAHSIAFSHWTQHNPDAQLLSEREDLNKLYRATVKNPRTYMTRVMKLKDNVAHEADHLAQLEVASRQTEPEKGGLSWGTGVKPFSSRFSTDMFSPQPKLEGDAAKEQSAKVDAFVAQTRTRLQSRFGGKQEASKETATTLPTFDDPMTTEPETTPTAAPKPKGKRSAGLSEGFEGARQ